jgi:hypothetical protein
MELLNLMKKRRAVSTPMASIDGVVEFDEKEKSRLNPNGMRRWSCLIL